MSHTSRPNRTYLPCGWIRRGVLGAMAGILAVGVGAAQTLPIRVAGLDAEGGLQVEYRSDPDSYFILHRLPSLRGSRQPVALRLGSDGNSTLLGPRAAAADRAFFQLERRRRIDPTDVDGDGLDDVYELGRPAILNPLDPADATRDPDGDGVGTLTEWRQGTDPEVAERRPTVAEFSPSPGSGGVSVRRETVVRFSRPLSEATRLDTHVFFAEVAGRRLLSRLELSPDRTQATLFYLEPLPGASRIRVTLQGETLRDADGLVPDVDGDGLPRGTARVDFDTSSTLAVPGTRIEGRIWASELPDSGVRRPLSGVTITVDGQEETLRAVTDAEGRFLLDPCPSGEFFVHVDGRTSPDSQWPGGAYYPFVGKKWTAAAGRPDNAATPTGDIYLPRIAANALTPVSVLEPTVVEFPSEVLSTHPELDGVRLWVPPNALVDEQGTRGGRVGIAPVAPDRLPEPLPPGLRFPLVITVQTDGPQNFDRPVPVRFPNLPDPRTGEALPPGSRSALWSFNHDTGAWEIAGPMTVTADGRFVETDPGVGIRQPGWHGTQPGASVSTEPKPNCPAADPSNPENLDDLFNLARALQNCLKDLNRTLQILNEIGELLESLRTFGVAVVQLQADYEAGRITRETLTAAAEVLQVTCEQIQSQVEALTAQNPVSKGIDAAKCASGLAKAVFDGVCRNAPCLGRVAQATCAVLSPSAGVLDALIQKVEDWDARIRSAPLGAVCLSLEALVAGLSQRPPSSPSPRVRQQTGPDPEILALLDDLARVTRQTEAGLEGVGEIQAELDGLGATLNAALNRALNLQLIAAGGLQQAHYALSVNDAVEQRGRFSAQGSLTLNVRSSTPYRIAAYSPDHHVLFVSTGTTPPNGVAGVFNPFRVEPLEDAPDSDGDGLPDVVEEVIGTSASRADSDDDGVSDLAEVRQGLDPLGGLPTQTGILASARVPGNAVDVAAADGRVVTANEAGGITVFDLANGLNPTAVAQVAIPSTATRVAIDAGFVAVAAGGAGLVVVDIADPPSARIRHQIPLGGEVLAVATQAGVAAVGTRSGELALVDLAGGAILSRVSLGEPVNDVSMGARVVHALTPNRLVTLESIGATLHPLQSTARGGGNRLFVGDATAYATHSRGFNTFDLSNPQAPRLIAEGPTAQFGWKQIVANGSGLGIAAVSPNSTFDGPHNISLYDLRNPAVTDAFLREIVTPGIARAVALYNGLAYVADGPAGLQVLNYLPFDREGHAPTIRLIAEGGTSRAEAGAPLGIRAAVTDDVQVALVSFWIDGIPAFTDGNEPFEFTFLVAPPRVNAQDSFQVHAVAVDTGGNATRSETLTFEIVPDATPPQIRSRVPGPLALVGSCQSVAVYFNEPIAPDTLTDASFRVRWAGADEVFGTADDALLQPVSTGTQPGWNGIVLRFDQSLPPGSYRATVGPPLSDLAGNVVDRSTTWDFEILGTADADQDGIPDNAERILGLDPANPDSNGNGIRDGAEDLDGDGLGTAWELRFGYDPRLKDSNGNGVEDPAEDPDLDVVPNRLEHAARTRPDRADSDLDGWNDEQELTTGSDPTDPASRPRLWVGGGPVVTLGASSPPPRDAGSGSWNTVIATPTAKVSVSHWSSADTPRFPPGSFVVARPEVRVGVSAPVETHLGGASWNTVVGHPVAKVSLSAWPNRDPLQLPSIGGVLSQPTVRVGLSLLPANPAPVLGSSIGQPPVEVRFLTNTPVSSIHP